MFKNGHTYTFIFRFPGRVTKIYQRAKVVDYNKILGLTKIVCDGDPIVINLKSPFLVEIIPADKPAIVNIDQPMQKIG